MNLSDYLRRTRIQQEESGHRYLVMILLAGTHLVSLIFLLFRSTPVILVPPDLPESVEISQNDASETLKESWGLFVAELLGNITPANAAFIEKSIGPMIDAGIYREVMDALSHDLEALKADRVAVRFKTREVIRDPTTDLIYVTGDLTSQGPGSPAKVSQRTYQLKIRFRHYRPFITDIDVYTGSPKGLDPTLLETSLKREK